MMPRADRRGQGPEIDLDSGVKDLQLELAKADEAAVPVADSGAEKAPWKAPLAKAQAQVPGLWPGE